MTKEKLDQQHLVPAYMARGAGEGGGGGGEESEQKTIETSLREREVGTNIN
jgi:hypothetical protein